MEEFVTTVHYRGFSFPIYIDDNGKFFTYVAGQVVKVADIPALVRNLFRQ